MPGRRSFLIGCGSMAAVPAFGAIGHTSPSSLPECIASAAAAEQPELADAHDLAFRIDGWEAPSGSESANDDRPSIRISSSWHAAWR
jgi:hypothetical protein